ncbi:MAG: 3D domain-containing protein [Desulfitobacterium sp.]
MYSLPIATYSDYWRSAKNRSLTMGGTLVIAGSTLMTVPPDAFPEKIEWRLPVLEFEDTALTTEGTAIPREEGMTGIEGSGVDSINAELALPGISGQVAMTYRIEDVEIPVGTEYIESDKVLPGSSQVSEEGQVGTERHVIRTTTVGGELTDEHIIHQFTLNAPKKRVVIQNTRPVEPLPVDLSQFNIVSTFEVEATAYTYTGNPTATGVWPREGLIAVDPRVIALGTEVYVEGYGYAIAADTGGAIKGNIIDVFFPSFQRCIEWGRRPVTIHILAKE